MELTVVRKKCCGRKCEDCGKHGEKEVSGSEVNTLFDSLYPQSGDN